MMLEYDSTDSNDYLWHLILRGKQKKTNTHPGSADPLPSQKVPSMYYFELSMFDWLT